MLDRGFIQLPMLCFEIGVVFNIEPAGCGGMRHCDRRRHPWRGRVPHALLATNRRMGAGL